MDDASLDARMTPFRITLVYVAVGVLWVLLSDLVAFTQVASPSLRSELQTVEGAAFVLLSGGLIYALTRYGRVRHRATAADLESRTREAHVLHRILRHNIRNKCNIIAGHAERIADDERAAPIIEQAEEMIELGEKSRLLREVSREEREPVEVDLSAAVADAVGAATGSHPDATVRVDCPRGVRVLAHPDIERAVRELVLNALKHGGPPVSVAVVHEASDEVALRVSDGGEGLPETERDVLEEGFRETQTYHSRGLGLWLVRYLVAESDGTVAVERTDERTTVRLGFQPSEAAVVDWFLR